MQLKTLFYEIFLKDTLLQTEFTNIKRTTDANGECCETQKYFVMRRSNMLFANLIALRVSRKQIVQSILENCLYIFNEEVCISTLLRLKRITIKKS